jgi:uncharacterized protein YfaP (DUF2135 family)
MKGTHIMKHKTGLTLLAFAVLTACGGSGGSKSEDPAAIISEPQILTSDNIAEAISVNGASVTSVSRDQVPGTLESVYTSNVESVVVSANSSFNVELSVLASDIPAGKKVAGYLLEITEGEFSFIPVAENRVSSANKNIISKDVISKKLKKSDRGFKSQPVVSGKAISAQAVGQEAEGETSVNIAGWGNSDFSLSENIESLKMRIYPLLVNESVASILTINDIDLTDVSNWVGMQELLLKVEAVATAQIQVSLTWNSETDIDLWIIGTDEEKIYYANPLSAQSLGWLDHDNTEAYGPENITFNYQMPEGDYKVYVHHYNGGVQTDYQVTVAIGDNVMVYNGDFPEGVTDSEAIDDAGVDFVTTITIDSAQNSQLKAPIATSQYQGIWKLAANSSRAGYVVINGQDVTLYVNYEDECSGNLSFRGEYLTTGFSESSGMLQVSDALLAGVYYFDENSTFTYATIDLQLSALPENCEIYVDDENEYSNEL